MTYFDRGDYTVRATREDVHAELLDNARAGDASVNLWEHIRDWVFSRPVDDVEVTSQGGIIVSIPSTYPDIFGNGTIIDRANRKAVEGGHLPSEIADYVTDHPATGGPLAVDVSALLEEGGELDFDNVEHGLREIEMLDDYPIFDESIWSDIEEEENLENWMDYGAHDTGILRDGETFKGDDGSIPLAILQGYWIDGNGDGPLIVEHNGYDTTFVIDADGVERARDMVAEYIVPAA